MQPELRSASCETLLPPDLGEGVSAPARDLEHGQRDDYGLALFIDELNHRIRNILTMVQAIVNQTQSTAVEDYRAKLTARISGLAGVHELVGIRGQSVRLTELLGRTLDACGTAHRFELTGPDVELEPRLSLALHLVFHELATNASKHGALRSALGRVKIEWQLMHVSGGGLMLAVLWTEHGGPVVKPPDHKGFGSRLIATALATQGRVELSFRSDGVACRMLVAIDKPLPV